MKAVEKKVLAFSGTGMMSGGSYRAGNSTFVESGGGGFEDNSLYEGGRRGSKRGIDQQGE